MKFKANMSEKIAEEMAVLCHAAKAMHWRMGQQEVAGSAGKKPVNRKFAEKRSF